MDRTSMIKSLDEKLAADVLGVAVQTMRNWRHLSKGPAYVKLGRAVRYRMDDLENYMDSKKIVALISGKASVDGNYRCKRGSVYSHR